MNPPLSGARDVKTIVISPDGGYVVYQADQEVDERFELYSVGTFGGAAPVKLNDPLVTNGQVFAAFTITGDGARVVFEGDAETDGVTELYSAPIDGSSSSVKLNLTPVLGGDVREFQCTPDGQKVVYHADQDVDDVQEIYVVPADGSAIPLRLSQSEASASDAVQPVLAPDGSFVVYFDIPSVGGAKIMRVPIDGSAAPILLSTGSVIAFALDPSGARVVFTATVNGMRELYAVPSDGSASPIKLDLRTARGGGRGV